MDKKSYHQIGKLKRMKLSTVKTTDLKDFEDQDTASLSMVELDSWNTSANLSLDILII